MLSSAVSSASNFCRRVSLSSMIWRRAEVRSRTEPFIFDLPPATICLIYDDAHVSDQGCHISNWPEGSAWPRLLMLRDTIAWWSEIIAVHERVHFLQDSCTVNTVVLSDDAPNQHQECCISMWREAACLNDCALSWADHMDIYRFNDISPGFSVFRDFWGAQKYTLIS